MGPISTRLQKTTIPKRLFWFGLIFVITLTTALILLETRRNKSSERKTSDKITGLSYDLFGKDLPECPQNTTNIFTKPFMEGDLPNFITPLGNSYEAGHVVPVDHVYPSNLGSEGDVAVYAPSDMTLIWVENKRMHNKNTDAVVRADYQLNFAPCRGLSLSFIHLKKVSEPLKAAIGDENQNCDTKNKIDYGIQAGIPTYYVTCHPEINRIKVSAGELVGYFSGQPGLPFSNFDIGLYDFNKPALTFVNPDRYYAESNHTVCFADYYTPELRNKYYAKFGSMGGQNGESLGKFVAVKGEPKCGKVMYDVAGTISGNWFSKPIEMRNRTADNTALVLVQDNLNHQLAKISWANVISFTFTPGHTGNINREFSEVRSDGNVYCYQPEENFSKGSYIDKEGKKIELERYKYLIQLIDTLHIKIEKQAGTCTVNNVFRAPLTYER